MIRSPASYLRNERGSSAIEFVLVIFAVVATVFFVLETTLYMFFSEALHKAAQAGVRAAVVSNPVVIIDLDGDGEPDAPPRNQRTASGLFGAPCPDNCVDVGTFLCTGGVDCVQAEFDNRIFLHMKGFAGQLEPENVTVSYAYDGLGFAGGPFIPLVTVSVSGVPFQTGIVGLLLSNAGVLATLPAHTVSMTGEDLNRGGAP